MPKVRAYTVKPKVVDLNGGRGQIWEARSPGSNSVQPSTVSPCVYITSPAWPQFPQMQNKAQFWINHTTAFFYFQGNLGDNCIFWLCQFSPYLMPKQHPQALVKRNYRVLVLGGTSQIIWFTLLPDGRLWYTKSKGDNRLIFYQIPGTERPIGSQELKALSKDHLTIPKKRWRWFLLLEVDRIPRWETL